MWETIAGFLPELINGIMGRRDVAREHKDDILLALSDAYHATHAYYAALNSGKHRDDEAEFRIANLWDRLSVLTREFDDPLADRFGLKSRYWREGAAWTSDEIRQANIGLDRIWTDTKTKFNRPRKKPVL